MKKKTRFMPNEFLSRVLRFWSK